MPTPVPPGPPAHVYVYYRVNGSPEVARESVARMMAALEADTGIRGRLLCRCEDDHTWMEIYEPIGKQEDFLPALAACAMRHGVDRHAVGSERHVECFTALPQRFAPSEG